MKGKRNYICSCATCPYVFSEYLCSNLMQYILKSAPIGSTYSASAFSAALLFVLLHYPEGLIGSEFRRTAPTLSVSLPDHNTAIIMHEYNRNKSSQASYGVIRISSYLLIIHGMTEHLVWRVWLKSRCLRTHVALDYFETRKAVHVYG